MNYKVLLVSDAENDIFEIYQYILYSDSAERAEYVYEQIREKCLGLSAFPERGHIPPELERAGVFEFRETHFKPYRIIYQINSDRVEIHCILDGRRSLDSLLHQRLLR
jgi:toxin ParE1/3/4